MAIDLVEKSKWVRRTALEMAIKSGRGHLGSAFSCVDILANLFYGGIFRQGTDHFILSKGHASLALYPILADKGYFPMEELQHFAEPGALLTEHPTNKIPGIDTTAGSLGHGLAIGVGIALAKPDSNVYVLLGDGECDEGSIWEAVQFAGKHRILNLFPIVDANGYGATGKTESVPLEWVAIAMGMVHFKVEHTVKGAGVPFMEEAGWHHQQMNAEQIALAREALK